MRKFSQVLVLSDSEVEVAERKLLQICSTQYLGIHWRPSGRAAVRRELANAAPDLAGSFGSNFLGGTHPARSRLESNIAELCNRNRGLAFSSGWAANYAIGETLASKFDLVVMDRRSHNSLIKGLDAGRAKVLRVDVTDPDWSSCLPVDRPNSIALAYPTLHGITGAYVEPCLSGISRADVFLVCDEAHSTGMFGANGFEEARLLPDARLMSLSKAIGVMGAVLCADSNFAEQVSQQGSPWIFSTAVPPLNFKIATTLVEVAQTLQDERNYVNELSQSFRAQLNKRGIVCTGNDHITGVHVPSDIKPSNLDNLATDRGLFIRTSAYPTMPKGKACARVSFSPGHTIEQVNYAARSLADCIEDLSK